jgi:hypothetical protein
VIGHIPLLARRGGCASKKMLRSHRSGADGVVAHKPCFKTHSETLFVSDHPVRSIVVASQHFLDVASTPPHEEGNNLAQKFVKKTKCLCPPRACLQAASPFHRA